MLIKINRMKTSDKSHVELYRLLGRLFFATAQADKIVHQKEIDKFKSLVKEKWLDFEHSVDEFGTDAAHQIEIVFYYLTENESNNDEILNDLKMFKDKHESLFTKELIDLILSTTNAIASSSSFFNKSELVFLSQLQLMLRR